MTKQKSTTTTSSVRGVTTEGVEKPQKAKIQQQRYT